MSDQAFASRAEACPSPLHFDQHKPSPPAVVLNVLKCFHVASQFSTGHPHHSSVLMTQVFELWEVPKQSKTGEFIRAENVA
jgi:hypothetical protein